MKFLGLAVIEVLSLVGTASFNGAVLPVTAFGGPSTTARVARRVSCWAAVPSDPKGDVPKNEDGISAVTPVGVSPELSQKEQKMLDLYQEWRSKCGQGQEPLDPQRFRTFSLYVIQSERALELDTYLGRIHQQQPLQYKPRAGQGKMRSTSASLHLAPQPSFPSSGLPPFLELNAYADCTPDEYREIKQLEAQGLVEPRQPPQVIPLANPSSPSERGEEATTVASVTEPTGTPEELLNPSLVADRTTTLSTTPGGGQRPLAANGRGSDGEDGDAIHSFLGRSQRRPITSTSFTSDNKSRPIPVDNRGPGENGAALASFSSKQQPPTPLTSVSSLPAVEKQLKELSDQVAAQLPTKSITSKTDAPTSPAAISNSNEKLESLNPFSSPSHPSRSSVRPDNRAGELVQRRATLFPKRTEAHGKKGTDEAPIPLPPVQSKGLSSDFAAASSSSATTTPTSSADPADVVRGMVRSAIIFPKRTEAHEQKLVGQTTSDDSTKKLKVGSSIVQADVFSARRSATTFPKREEVLAKISKQSPSETKIATTTPEEVKSQKTTASTQRTASSHGSEVAISKSFVKPDVFFREKSATTFPKRIAKINEGHQYPSQNLQQQQISGKEVIKPNHAGTISEREATLFPKKRNISTDSYVALVKASLFRDEVITKNSEATKSLPADQKQMNLGAPFSFAKRGLAEDLPPPDADDVMLAEPFLLDDSTIEVSEAAYQIKDVEDEDEAMKPRKRMFTSPFQEISTPSKERNNDVAKLDVHPPDDNSKALDLETVTEEDSSLVMAEVTRSKLKVEPPSFPMPDGPVSAEQYRVAAEARLRQWSHSFNALEEADDTTEQKDVVSELANQLQKLREELERVEAESLEKASVAKELFQRSLLESQFRLKKIEIRTRVAEERKGKIRRGNQAMARLAFI